MKNKNYLVAFIDILGFKNLIDNHFSDKDKHSLPLLKKAMKEAESFAIKYSKSYLKKFEIKFSFKQFSDCVCISMPFEKELNQTALGKFGAFTNVVRMYQFILLSNNFLVRGGISAGGHFENSNMIFSDGLVKSYKIENQKAIYPRILLDKDLLDLIENILKSYTEDTKEFYDLYGHSIIKDWDDEIFLSPFGFVSECKTLGNNYGVEALNDILDIYAEANKLEFQIPDNLLEKLNSSNGDKEMIKPILESINRYILENATEKFDTLVKYKWLRQFLIWNITPNKSQIKFEHYFGKRK